MVFLTQMPVAWKQKFTSVMLGKNWKNAYKNCKNEHFEKRKFVSLSCPKESDHSTQKLVCPVAHSHTDTDTQTDRVTTEGTLSGFQDFFLQPIIKERPNICFLQLFIPSVIAKTRWLYQHACQSSWLHVAILSPLFPSDLLNAVNVKLANLSKRIGGSPEQS